MYTCNMLITLVCKTPMMHMHCFTKCSNFDRDCATKILIHFTARARTGVVWMGTTGNMMNVMVRNTMMMEMMENLMEPSTGVTRMR